MAPMTEFFDPSSYYGHPDWATNRVQPINVGFTHTVIVTTK